jgi:hypothetical protein
VVFMWLFVRTFGVLTLVLPLMGIFFVGVNLFIADYFLYALRLLVSWTYRGRLRSRGRNRPSSWTWIRLDRFWLLLLFITTFLLIRYLILIFFLLIVSVVSLISNHLIKLLGIICNKVTKLSNSYVVLIPFQYFSTQQIGLSIFLLPD